MDPAEASGTSQVCILERFAEAAARRLVDHLAGRLRASGRVHVALTGGRTARQVYEALGRPEFRQALDWSAIEVYQGDERPVPPDHPDSNWGMAEKTFLDAMGVPHSNRHRMRGEAANLDEAAREYGQILEHNLPREHGAPAFDLLLLGMGPDGHTASLFPGTAALSESRRRVVANEVPQHRTMRLTITYPVINAARAVWILAGGADKADAAVRSIEGLDSSLPVTRVAPVAGALTWLLDEAAAARLGPRTRKPD